MVPLDSNLVIKFDDRNHSHVRSPKHVYNKHIKEIMFASTNAMQGVRRFSL